MERKITTYLLDWKNSPYRKPLILQGARQAGRPIPCWNLDKSTMGMGTWLISILRPIPV